MTMKNDRRTQRPILHEFARRATFSVGVMVAAIALPCAAETSDPTTPTTTPPTTQIGASAAPATSTPSSEIAKRLQTRYPSTHFGAVNATAWPGVFEVLMGANLAYVDESGQYFLFGHLYDMNAQRDITAEHKDTLARIDFASLPLADAIKEVRGNGKRVLAIFSDPECPYCRRLESDLKTLTDVTLYTFLMPIASLHPTAQGKAVAVWCAKDRVTAWHAAMWRDETLPHGDCRHPVDRNIALGERLGVVGTPTLIASDGRVMPGAASKEQIEAWLDHPTARTQATAAPAAAPR